MASQAVLFDFDGTLADTAPDLAAAVNRMRRELGQEPLPLARLRPFSSAGARGLLHAAFGIKPGDADYDAMRETFLEYYAERICHETRLFPGIAQLIAAVPHIAARLIASIGDCRFAVPAAIIVRIVAPHVDHFRTVLIWVTGVAVGRVMTVARPMMTVARLRRRAMRVRAPAAVFVMTVMMLTVSRPDFMRFYRWSEHRRA